MPLLVTVLSKDTGNSVSVLKFSPGMLQASGNSVDLDPGVRQRQEMAAESACGSGTSAPSFHSHKAGMRLEFKPNRGSNFKILPKQSHLNNQLVMTPVVIPGMIPRLFSFLFFFFFSSGNRGTIGMTRSGSFSDWKVRAVQGIEQKEAPWTRQQPPCRNLIPLALSALQGQLLRQVPHIPVLAP